MKKIIRKLFICFCVTIITIMPCSYVGKAGANSSAYEYQWQVIPGTDEWAAFKTHDEMITACQIPEKQLNDMSTDQLLNAFLNYPLLIDLYAYNSIEEGFKAIRSQFTGLDVLLKRDDLPQVLINEYKNCQVVKHESSTSIESFYKTNKVTLLETLLAQPEVDKKLTVTEKRNVLREVKAKLDEKLETTIYESEETAYFQVLNDAAYESDEINT